MREILVGLTLGCFAALAFATAANADEVYSDGTFANADYALGFQTTGGTGYGATFGQCASCGDPSGLGLTSTFTTAANGGTAGATADFIGMMNDTFMYNPTTGAVTSIDVSIDKDLSANLVNTYGNTFRFLIEQDGNFYQFGIPGPALVIPTGTANGTTGYNLFSSSGITASEFGLLNLTTGAVNTAMNPNFDGDPLTFGIGQYLSETGDSGDDPTVVYDYDNFSVTVHTASVPEPFTLSLFGAGLAGAAALRRRKKAKA